MAAITLHGTILPDGSVRILEKHDLLPGVAVEIVVRTTSYEADIEATKQWMAQQSQQELTEAERTHLRSIYAILDEAVIEESGLPDDYADELDHYLYGTPKRNSGQGE